MNRTVLLKALELVKPGLASKELIEQSTSFAFMKGRVVTYNDEISISHPVPDMDFEGAVKAEELYKFLSKVKQEDIGMACTDSEIRLTAGRTKVGLVLMPEIRLPLDEISDATEWTPLPKDFIQAVKFVRFSCSRNMAAPIFTCINIRKDGVLESTDRQRLTQYQLGDELPAAFLLPASSANDLIKYNVKEISPSEGWMHFRAEAGTVFSCRVFADNFPDTADKMQVDGVEVTFPATIDDILDKAVIFAQRDSVSNEELITVKLDKNLLTIEARKESSWFKEDANMRYGGAPVSFAVSPQFLRDMLGQTRSCILGERTLKFNGEKWQHVVALDLSTGSK